MALKGRERVKDWFGSFSSLEKKKGFGKGDEFSEEEKKKAIEK